MKTVAIYLELRSEVLSTIWLCALICSATAHADTIFDSFGWQPIASAPLYHYDSLWIYSDIQQEGLGQGFAASFNVPLDHDYQVEAVTVDVVRGYGENGPNLNLSIVEDDHGWPSEAVVGLVTSNPTSMPVWERQQVTFHPSLEPLLSAGKTYWLRIEPNFFDTQSWSNSDSYTFSVPPAQEGTPVVTRSYDLASGQWGGWQSGTVGTPALRIEAEPVPEPGQLVLLSVGAATLRFFRRKGRRSEIIPVSRVEDRE